jgi:hypothetical protein
MDRIVDRLVTQDVEELRTNSVSTSSLRIVMTSNQSQKAGHASAAQLKRVLDGG